MAKVPPTKGEVLIRPTSTTTYHFGASDPLCEDADPKDAWAKAVRVPLDEALYKPRRLCPRCADLVAEWSAIALSVASATDIIHRDR